MDHPDQDRSSPGLVQGGLFRRPTEELRARALEIRALLLDVDGVLADGGIFLGSGDLEMKRFDVQDGMGVSLAHRGGLRTGILTGRVSECVSRRGKELGMEWVIQGAHPKLPAFQRFLTETGLGPGQVAYMGDDLQDLPVLLRSGLSFAPANARPEVRERVHVVTESHGGHGAVREAIEILLVARGDWPELLAEYLEAP